MASLEVGGYNFGQFPFDIPEFSESTPLTTRQVAAPFWFLLYERVDSQLLLALGRPAGVDASKRVHQWSDLIRIRQYDGFGDLSIVGDSYEFDEINVEVELLDG